MTLTIRQAERTDVPAILGMIQALAEYEREPDAVEATAETLENSLFGEQAVPRALIAEMEGRPVGFAIYFFNFSTWTGRPGVYLEDLYVDPARRGSGIGRALLAKLAQVAVERDCRRLEWWVLDWNEPAIEFYRSLGAKPMSDWTVYRVDGEALASLAASA